MENLISIQIGSAEDTIYMEIIAKLQKRHFMTRFLLHPGCQ